MFYSPNLPGRVRPGKDNATRNGRTAYFVWKKVTTALDQPVVMRLAVLTIVGKSAARAARDLRQRD